ncbi:MAG: carbohydrate ABC transporter permease [Pseudonocardiales bacterium]|nr:MAG: carbohydrate ABC transporter permease [Pseudonocardiales bacterium]
MAVDQHLAASRGSVATPRHRSGRRHRAAGLTRRALTYLVIVVLAVFCVVPFAWVLLGSVDSKAGLYLRAPHLTLHNFLRFFDQPTTPRLLVNSLVLSGGGTVVALFLSMFGGYALSRYRFFGRRTLMFAILLVRVVPPTATIVPLYIIMIDIHLNNTYVGVILVEAAYQIPLLLWLMKGFFDSIPVGLEEAAWIDGCSRVSGVLHVVFPLSRPGIGAGALFAFVNIWGDFLTPLVLLQSPDRYPISIGLFQAFSAFNQVDWGLLTATAVLYMVPTVLLYLFARRYLLQATVTGAIKG